MQRVYAVIAGTNPGHSSCSGECARPRAAAVEAEGSCAEEGGPGNFDVSRDPVGRASVRRRRARQKLNPIGYGGGMWLEMHCHSTCSDGSFAPEEVAGKAMATTPSFFFLTDHDTFEGFERAKGALADGVATAPALELSCKYEGRTVHLLMYGLKEGDALNTFQIRLDKIRVARVKRLREICDRFATLGVELDAEKILSTAHGSPGRPHIAKAVVEAGAATSIKEVFDRWLHDGGPAAIEIERISLEDGLTFGKSVGAKMSMAHPHTLKSPALVEEIVRTYRDAGLEGLEAFYGGYAVAQRRPWLDLVEGYKMVATGGSDFHGEATPRVARPTIDIPDSYANAIVDWLEIDVAPTA